jgi:glycerol-3-phosphate dehydrogenase
MAAYDTEVAVVGGGVVGCAVARHLALRGVATIVLEAEDELGRAASGTNSGILHTGFDSKPGELETELILRAAELRAEALPGLGVPLLRCGAVLRPRDAGERAAVAELAENARGNGVATAIEPGGALCVPGESVTDPVAFTASLAEQARATGATVLTGSPVDALARANGGGVTIALGAGGGLRARGVANCAGLHADELAAGAAGGAAPFEVYPRKGEFLVFDQPAEPLDRILLPVPSAAGKGVLVFPTVDGHVIAGPTARDRSDKLDWSVETDAAELILPRAVQMLPALEGAEPLAAYAGLRPAGRGVNYAIARSRAIPGVVDAGAIRSTGLTAALAIAEHVAALLVEAAGLAPAEPAPPATLARRAPQSPWWRLAAERSRRSAERR